MRRQRRCWNCHAAERQTNRHPVRPRRYVAGRILLYFERRKRIWQHRREPGLLPVILPSGSFARRCFSWFGPVPSPCWRPTCGSSPVSLRRDPRCMQFREALLPTTFHRRAKQSFALLRSQAGAWERVNFREKRSCRPARFAATNWVDGL